MADGNPQLTPAAFQTLLALANGRGGRAHGYAIMGFVDQVSGGTAQLGPGTLYRTLARLVADGLVEEAPDASEDQPHDSRRRYYRLTSTGRDVATREAEFLSRLVAVAGQAGLLKRAESA
ncbi:PadR family transcriptional regulator [Amycolatopsis decaplanina]|uniref:PadR family transcriptional regulator n=1 Tax=Amycolatopsis decaplanina DSM 44594 TaxID=1284240 RepID=M2YEM6_9PSEU|nr:PadR family transcriptional regulator [Amycolatopsis decaplanina]EME53327.1 PadR family transcriptional regulator [Amycolatopsis decaplanina DSM 44594]